MNWIVIETSEINSETSVLVSGPRHEHIKNILKKKEGDLVQVVIPNVGNFRFQVIRLAENETVLKEVEVLPRALSPLSIKCFFSLPRPQTAKKILHLAGAYGIESVFFFATETKNKEYWTSPVYTKEGNDLLFTGMSQTGNCQMPKVHMGKNENWKTFLESYPGIVQILDRVGTKEIEIPREQREPTNKQLFVFGPESGWKESDWEFFKRYSLDTVSLGNINLRTEFAFSSLLYFLFKN